jgi:hypothetical protein
MMMKIMKKRGKVVMINYVEEREGNDSNGDDGKREGNEDEEGWE